MQYSYIARYNQGLLPRYFIWFYVPTYIWKGLFLADRSTNAGTLTSL